MILMSRGYLERYLCMHYDFKEHPSMAWITISKLRDKNLRARDIYIDKLTINSPSSTNIDSSLRRCLHPTKRYSILDVEVDMDLFT